MFAVLSARLHSCHGAGCTVSTPSRSSELARTRETTSRQLMTSSPLPSVHGDLSWLHCIGLRQAEPQDSVLELRADLPRVDAIWHGEAPLEARVAIFGSHDRPLLGGGVTTRDR